MKIEKLTDNKIRVIINLEDLEENHIDSDTIMSKPMEAQTLLLEMLLKAEKEVGFYTDGCKLLIEAFSSSDGIFVFTITKYEDNNSKKQNYISLPNKRKVVVKKKSININSKSSTFKFNDFEEFCNLCININDINDINIKKISKNISLYLYNNTYYLIIADINPDYENINKFYSIISEFATLHTHSNTFENKVMEHGKAIIKKNAINLGIKYFANK